VNKNDFAFEIKNNFRYNLYNLFWWWNKFDNWNKI